MDSLKPLRGSCAILAPACFYQGPNPVVAGQSGPKPEEKLLFSENYVLFCTDTAKAAA